MCSVHLMKTDCELAVRVSFWLLFTETHVQTQESVCYLWWMNWHWDGYYHGYFGFLMPRKHIITTLSPGVTAFLTGTWLGLQQIS